MNCPFCNTNDSQVLESRVINEGQGIRRRRECGKCNKRFTTHEEVKKSVLWIIKKDGKREPFDREKVKSTLFPYTTLFRSKQKKQQFV